MKRCARLCIIMLVLWTSAGASALAGAQTVPPSTIAEIEVVGALTVGSRQVLAWSGLEVGETLTTDLEIAATPETLVSPVVLDRTVDRWTLDRISRATRGIWKA